MKALTSVTCVVLTLLVLANRLTEEYIRTLRNSNSEMFDCFFNICAPWKSCTGRGLRKGAWGIVSFVLEIAICLFHIPPGVQGHVHSTWTFGAEDDLGDASKDFDVNINLHFWLDYNGRLNCSLCSLFYACKPVDACVQLVSLLCCCSPFSSCRFGSCGCLCSGGGGGGFFFCSPRCICRCFCFCIGGGGGGLCCASVIVAATARLALC